MVDEPGIELRNISFHIGNFAIADLSFSVPRGKYHVLTGANGSGKTILIKLIAGLLAVESGKISILGKDITTLPSWRRKIGYVPQDGVLFPNRDVRRNILFGLEMCGTDQASAEKSVQEIATMLKVDHLLERDTRGLSGGECQKVSLARALVFEPDVLLLDEPLSAIDEDAREELCSDLRRIQHETGVTTLHIAHNRREIELLADIAGSMKAGSIQDMSL